MAKVYEQPEGPDEITKKWAMARLLPFIEACPQIVKSEIGVEAFAEELNRACIKIVQYFHKED